MAAGVGVGADVWRDRVLAPGLAGGVALVVVAVLVVVQGIRVVVQVAARVLVLGDVASLGRSREDGRVVGRRVDPAVLPLDVGGLAGAGGVAGDGERKALGVDEQPEPGAGAALDDGHALLGQGGGEGLDAGGPGALVAGLLGDVVEPTVAGGDDKGLDRLGVILELGDDGGLGQVEEVVADQ